MIFLKDPMLDKVEGGLYHDISRINHACVPNALWTWRNEDREYGSLEEQRKQIRALRTIEKDEEIVINFRNEILLGFHYGSKGFRRQDLLENLGFLCKCSECSLEGKALLENEWLRAEIRDKKAHADELGQEADCIASGLGPAARKIKLKKAVKLVLESWALVQKMELRHRFVSELTTASCWADKAKMMDIPDRLMPEALEYAKKYGDCSMNSYTKGMDYLRHRQQQN